MPIDSDTMRKPSLIEHEEGWTVANVDASERFMDFSQYPRSYREGRWLQNGWTAGQDTLAVEEVDINQDGLSFTPR